VLRLWILRQMHNPQHKVGRGWRLMPATCQSASCWTFDPIAQRVVLHSLACRDDGQSLSREPRPVAYAAEKIQAYRHSHVARAFGAATFPVLRVGAV